ncbi:MAG: penicillin acylase family protein, partial [Alphaproteobacteria bacterium]
QTEGTLRIAALAEPVEVLRDGDGVVTIRAQSEADAAVALGYVHAQDRLWQMDFMRRSGAGRLSEVVGPATSRLDRFMRTLGLYRVAEANVEQASPALRAMLDAYAEGVNAFIADPGGPLPLEFQLLRYSPEPWRPADSLVWGRLMALQLSGNWTEEILRARVARHLTPQQVADLWPAYPADGLVTLTSVADDLIDLPLRDLASILPWELAPKDASNSWVLAGALTASGKPLLANDPHLALSAPGQWYLARIETPELTRTGATAPGVPFLIAGHNGRIAWGFTTTHSDTQDLFIERTDPSNPARYLTPTGTELFETREETITILGEEPDVITVRGTRHGPVISDAVGEAADVAKKAANEAGGDHSVLALAWPALRADDRTAEALLAISRARNWAEFKAATVNFHSPQQNIVFADITGTIGFAAPARVPVRKRGDGRLPVPGWSGEFDWQGTIPFADLPMQVNPPSQRVIVANNKIVPDDYPYFLTADWPAPYRAQRIQELLDVSDRTSTSVENSQTIQQDVLSLAARTLLPHLLQAQPNTDRGREALDILANWDGGMHRDSPAPLLFYAWLNELNRVLLSDELDGDFAQFQRPKADILLRVLSESPAWCNDVTTGPAEDCQTQLIDALESALTKLALRFPKTIGQLRWGDAHRVKFKHPFLSRIPVLGSFFAYSVESDGGSYTINRGGVSFAGTSSNLFEDVHGPGYRAVYDLADLDNSRFMIATGQSGNPLSSLYGNLATRWRDGDYLKLVGDTTATTQTLRLTP